MRPLPDHAVVRPYLLMSMADQRTPFSSQWYATASTRRAVKRIGSGIEQSIQQIVDRLPARSALTAGVMVVLVVASAWLACPSTDVPIAAPAISNMHLPPEIVATLPPRYVHISTRSIQVSVGSENGPLATGSGEAEQAVLDNSGTPSP